MASPMITNQNVHGRCIRCSSELMHYAGVDYIIEISKLTWDLLDDKAKYLLVYHELLHIKIEYEENKDEYKFKLRKHNIEDFREIIERHGVSWLSFVEQTKKKPDNIEEDSDDD